MELQQLNEVAIAASSIEIIPLAKLTPGKVKRIHEISQVHTSYGQRYIVQLDNNQAVFLPKRVCEHLRDTPKAFEALEEKIQNSTYGIKYIGSRLNKLEFVEIKKQ